MIFLSYLLQNLADCDKIWYRESWMNFQPVECVIFYIREWLQSAFKFCWRIHVDYVVDGLLLSAFTDGLVDEVPRQSTRPRGWVNKATRPSRRGHAAESTRPRNRVHEATRPSPRGPAAESTRPPRQLMRSRLCKFARHDHDLSRIKLAESVCTEKG